MPLFADNMKAEEAWEFCLRSLQPMKTKEKAMAKQVGWKPINPNATPAASAPAAQQ
jgi:hypothetical protein